MKKTLLLGIILFLLFAVPGDTIAQPFDGHGFVNPLGAVTAGPVNGGLHFHTNPSEEHYMYESLEHHSYQYYALHGYEHYGFKELRNFDRFRDIQYPRSKPYCPSNFDSFFGFEYQNPLKC